MPTVTLTTASSSPWISPISVRDIVLRAERDAATKAAAEGVTPVDVT